MLWWDVCSKEKQILNQPEQDVWQNVVTSLGRNNFILEGHYAECLWAPALSVIDEDYARSVKEAILELMRNAHGTQEQRI